MCLQCNKARLPGHQGFSTGQNPPQSVSVCHVLLKTDECHVYNLGQKTQLGFVLGNGLLDPAKKPSKSFLPTVVLGIRVNPPYPSSINKWHAWRGGSSGESGLRLDTYRALSFFISTRLSKANWRRAAGAGTETGSLYVTSFFLFFPSVAKSITFHGK